MEREQPIITAWWGEVFARTEKLKPLDTYLKEAKPARVKADEGARDLREMIQRKRQKQEARSGTG